MINARIGVNSGQWEYTGARGGRGTCVVLCSEGMRTQASMSYYPSLGNCITGYLASCAG